MVRGLRRLLRLVADFLASEIDTVGVGGDVVEPAIVRGDHDGLREDGGLAVRDAGAEVA